MTAFLFIPATVGSGDARRLDFAGLAGLFAEPEEPARRKASSRAMLRVAVAALLALVAIGDTLMVARPGALDSCPAPRPEPARATF